MTLTRLAPALLLAACTAAPGASTAPVPEAVDEAVFTLRQGADTAVVERFTRTPDRLDVEMAVDGGPRIVYDADLRPDASVARLAVRAYAPGAGPEAAPAQTMTALFEGDSVLLAADAGETQRRGTVAGVVPYLNPSPSAMEQIVRRARAMGTGRVEVPVWMPGEGGQNETATVDLSTPGEAALTMGGVEVRLQVDEHGRVLGGTVPSQGLTLERAPATP